MAAPVGESRSTKDILAASPVLARAGAAIATYEMGTQAITRGRAWWSKRTTYKVSIEEGDPTFDLAHDWLMSIIPDREHKDLKVIGGDRRGDDNSAPVDPSGTHEPAQRPLRVVIDDESQHTFSIEGHRVKVSVSKPDNTMAEGGRRSSFRRPQVVVFECRSPAAQQAVVRKIQSLRDSVNERVPVLQMATTWGSWSRRSDLPLRTWASVILPAEQKAELRADVERFLRDESRYNRLGLPYHRGYLLHGPPGTGKTSLARALATEFNLDLWYASLGDMENEARLINMIADVRPRSILLLEDIDTVSIATSRETDGASSMTTGSLLNALDGVATPHGLITVMTTNHLDRIDPALTRAGRMDRAEHIGMPTAEVVADMFAYFYGCRPVGAPPATGMSQAEVAEVFKRHFEDPAAAWRELSRVKAPA